MCLYVTWGRRRGNTIPVTERRPHTARIQCRRCAGRMRLGCLVWQVTEFSLNHKQVISDPHMMIWWWAFRAVIFRRRKYWQSTKYRCTLILCCYISTWEGQNYLRRYRYGVCGFLFPCKQTQRGMLFQFYILFCFFFPLCLHCVYWGLEWVSLSQMLLFIIMSSSDCVPGIQSHLRGSVDCCPVNEGSWTIKFQLGG